jgi:DNA-binding CsgD family transcriptional regulator
VRWLADTFPELTPRLDADQIRAVMRVGIILRWVAVAFAGLAGLLAPRAPRFLTEEILVAMIYNAIVMGTVKRAPDNALPILALVTTVIDQAFCFTFIGLYNVLPGGHQVAAYIPAMIEAVAFFGLAGAFLSSGFFFGAILLVQSTGVVLGWGTFDGVGVFGTTMIVILIGACLAGVNQALSRSAHDSTRKTSSAAALLPDSWPELSGRDQEVLRLIAQGCSNAVIATRLGVSERTIKATLERLLTRLKARNRAEAVAAASRLQLL